MSNPIRYTYVDTIGLKIKVDMNATITGATGLKLVVRKPETDTIVEWNAALESDRYLVYTTIANDLDEVGWYEVQPVFTLSGWTGPGKIVGFEVKEKIE